MKEMFSAAWDAVVFFLHGRMKMETISLKADLTRVLSV